MKHLLVVLLLLSSLTAQDDVIKKIRKLSDDVDNLLDIQKTANDLCLDIPIDVMKTKKILEDCESILANDKAILARHKDDKDIHGTPANHPRM
jgi:hypothetical protein